MNAIAQSSQVMYTEGYRFRLYADSVLLLPEEFEGYSFSAPWGKLENRLLTQYEGYAWDGASGPTIDGKCSIRGSLGHDGIYQAIREGLLPRSLKDAGDKFLYEQCVEDLMPRWRAWLWRRGVKKFGLSATVRNRNILVAP